MSLGFVFPGQGAQQVGMLSQFAAGEPSIRRRFEEATAVIGEPLDRYVFEGPEETLNLTAYTQPAILTASVALWEIWRQRGGPLPDLLAGHSLGEYTALVCGGALSFAEGVKLVHLRGTFMQSAVAPGAGAIAAILGLGDEQVVACCAGVSGVVTPANYNAPGQVAIAGERIAVEAAIDACKAAGAKRAVMLNLSVPVHCELMAPAAEALRAALSATTLKLPTIPIVHNLDAAIADSVEALQQRLLGQLAQPVQWTRCIAKMSENGVDQIVECGPGRVLSGLVKRIDRSIQCHAIDDEALMTNAIAALNATAQRSHE